MKHVLSTIKRVVREQSEITKIQRNAAQKVQKARAKEAAIKKVAAAEKSLENTEKKHAK